MTVRNLLSDESKWAQGYYAFDKDGNQVECSEKKACKWCLIGALAKCYPKDIDSAEFWDKQQRILRTIYKLFPEDYHQSGLVGWNDSRETTWEKVNKVLDEAGV